MCGRMTLHADLDEVLGHFDVDAWSETHLPPRFNIAPSQGVPAVRLAADGGRELVLLRWGLLPHWAKEERLRYSTINARAETAATTPTYRDPFRRRRCLIPADGFYEWQVAEGGAKQPWYIRPKGGGLLGFAGLWDHWEGQDGKIVESCTVVVTEANDALRPIHDRMPVILAPEDYATWVDVNRFDRQELEGLLRPYPPERLEAYRVSKAVNNPRHDAPDCIEPLASAQ